MARTPRILVISDRKRAGKSLVGEMLAELTDGTSCSVSDSLEHALLWLSGMVGVQSPAEKDDIRRQQLYHLGLCMEVRDPLVWIRHSLAEHNVVTGVRTAEAYDAAMGAALFDCVVFVCSDRGSQDEHFDIGDSCEQEVVRNWCDTDLDALRQQCVHLVDSLKERNPQC